MGNIFKRKSVLFSALVFIVLATSQAFLTNQASAAYRAGNLTDDSVFLNTNSMSLTQIQSFLTSMEGQIATKTFYMDCDLAGQQAKYIYLSINAPCGSTATSAQVIHYAARVYGINPQVIIATIQKEQSLITAKNPTQRQYGQVMGYACPTTGECDSNSNFLWQVDNGTWALRYHFERARGNNTWWNSGTWAGSGCGGETRYRKPSAYPRQNVAFYDEGGRHYSTVYIENAATSAFYCYTPHVYNNFPGCISAWGVSYANWKATAGSTGNCYSGSYNYVTAFEAWFGSVHDIVIVDMEVPRWMRLRQDTYKYSHGDANPQLPILASGLQVYLSDKYYSNGQWYLRTQFSKVTGRVEGILLTDLEEIPIQPTTPRWMSVKESVRKIDPIRVNRFENVDSMRAVKVFDTISVNGLSYYRTEFDKINNNTIFIPASSLEEFKLYNLLSPRILYTKNLTSKVNVLTGEIVSTLQPNTYIDFGQRITVNGKLYVQSHDDKGTTHAIDINDLEETHQLPFVKLDNPRLMQIAEDLYKKRAPKMSNFGQLLRRGQRINFQDKVYINGDWYLRSQWDKDNGNFDVIPLKYLSEIN